MGRRRRRYRRRWPGKGAGLAVLGGLALAAAVHASVPGTSAGTPAAAAGQTLTTASGNVAVGQRLAAGYGWGAGPEWTCLDELWTRESGWRLVWNTAGSGAYGIPQSLPASKMAAAGTDYMTNPATQIRWGLGYIASAYRTPCGAWAHEEQDGWY